MASLLAGYPLDTVKVNQQSREKATSMVQASAYIYGTQGIKGKLY